MRAFAFALILAATAAPAWAVNKCVDANGKVSYQEGACSTGVGQQLEILNTRSQPTMDDRLASWRAKQAEIRSACGARADKPVEIGMSIDDLMCTDVALRSSKKINSTKTAAGTQLQYVFTRASGRPTLVYVENAAVTAIQQ